MTIYGRVTRAGNPQNPAKALYSYWHSILSPIWGEWQQIAGRPAGGIGFGPTTNMGIGPIPMNINTSPPPTVESHGGDQYPHLGFGYFGGGSIHPMFLLTRQGEFWITRQKTHGRGVIARNTFLGVQYHRSRWQWYVDPLGGLAWSRQYLDNWRSPIHYVSSEIAEVNWHRSKTWLKLEHAPSATSAGGLAGDDWAIRFSRTEEPVGRYQRPGPDRAEFDKYEALRLKRYERTRRFDLIASGEIIARGRRTVSTNDLLAEQAVKAKALAEHLVINPNPKSTPLRKEVRNGSHDMGSLDQTGAAALASQ